MSGLRAASKRMARSLTMGDRSWSLAIALGGALVALATWSLILTQPLDWLGLDLYPTWIAAHLFASGRYDAVYHPSLWIAGHEHPAWAAIMEQNGIPRGDGTSFTYSPVYLLIVSPFMNAVSVRQASQVMLGINAVSVGVIGSECARLAGLRSKWTTFLICVLTGLSFPAIGAMWLGQNTLPCLAAALLGERAMTRKDLAGRAVGLSLWWLAAAMKPWFVMAFVVLFAMRLWREAIVGLLGWGVLFVVLPFFGVPAELRQGYARVGDSLLRVTVVPWNNVSIRAHLLRLSWHEWPTMAATWQPIVVSAARLVVEVGILAGVAAFLILWLQRRPRRELVFVMGLFAVLLPLGICWTHYLAFGLPLLVVSAFHRGLPRGARWVGAMGCLYALLGFPHHFPTVLHRWKTLASYVEQAQAFPLLTAWQIEIPMLVFLAVAVTLALSTWTPASTRRPSQEPGTTS
jgi:hypothetical protein